MYRGALADVQCSCDKQVTSNKWLAPLPCFEVIMIENQKIRPTQVVGPLGEALTLETLPAPSTTRWVVRRKAEGVAARSEEHTSEPQPLMRISYAGLSVKKK